MLVQLPYLRQTRHYRLLSQEDLAKKCDVSRQTILRIEAGGLARVITAKKMAEALNTTTDYLMGREGQKKKPPPGG